MKLSYRGAHYETHESPVINDGVEMIGNYRGAPVTRRHFHVNSNAHHRVEMTYRGIKYSQSM